MGCDVRLAVSTSIFVQILVLVARMLLAKRMIAYSIQDFIRCVLVPLLCVSVVSCIIPLCIYMYFGEGLTRFLFSIGITVLSTITTVYFVGLEKEERQLLYNGIKKKLHSIHNDK